jgi:hypothetical protein
MTQHQPTPVEEPALQPNTITCDCDQPAHRIGEDLYLCERCKEVIYVQPHGFVFYPIGRFRAFKDQPRTRPIPSRRLEPTTPLQDYKTTLRTGDRVEIYRELKVEDPSIYLSGAGR